VRKDAPSRPGRANPGRSKSSGTRLFLLLPLGPRRGAPPCDGVLPLGILVVELAVRAADRDLRLFHLLPLGVLRLRPARHAQAGPSSRRPCRLRRDADPPFRSGPRLDLAAGSPPAGIFGAAKPPGYSRP